MKARRVIRRLTAIAAAVVAATVGLVVIGVARPAYAVASCGSGLICFYHDWKQVPGGYTGSGTMSNQTATLVDRPQTILFYEPGKITVPAEVPVQGKISNFGNSHYTNGQGLSDSTSFVVNNSDRCMWVFSNPNYGYPALEMGPHTVRVLLGTDTGPNGKPQNIGQFNDNLQSAFTVAGSSDFCHAGSNQTLLNPK